VSHYWLRKKSPVTNLAGPTFDQLLTYQYYRTQVPVAYSKIGRIRICIYLLGFSFHFSLTRIEIS